MHGKCEMMKEEVKKKPTTEEKEEEAKDGAKNSNMLDIKVKRKQPKVRSNDFACKQCELKF